MSHVELSALKALAAFMMAGTYVTTMARIAEKFGSKVGGLILALPSTALIGMTFIAWTQGHDELRQASVILPVTFAAATVFMASFIKFSRYGLLAGYAGAIVTWLAITLPVALSHLHNVVVSVALATAIYAVMIVVFRHIPHRTATPLKNSLKLVALRFSVAGTVAAATVIVAYLAGARWGAVCASFPAVFSATLYLMTRSQGIEFTASLGRTMIFGCISTSVFGGSIWIYGTWLPSAPTIIAAYFTSLVAAVLAYRYLIDLFSERVSQSDLRVDPSHV